jgi:Domain of unknown function (DUF6647)
MLKQTSLCLVFVVSIMGGTAGAQQPSKSPMEVSHASQTVDFDSAKFRGGEVFNPDLLTSVAAWISRVLGLPETPVLPNVQRFPVGKLAALASKAVLSDRQLDTAAISYRRSGSEMVAYYSDVTKTIHLPESWTGNTPAEMSILVHAMVHHLQNVTGLKFYCAQERKELAYAAQERWLGLYERNLLDDFGVDPTTLMMMTQCIP